MSETTSTTGTAAAPVADNTRPLASEPKGRTGAARILAGRDAITIYALVAFLIYAAIAIPRFASPVTTGFLLLDVIPVLLIAMPMTLIIITGEIDLSVASIAGLASALMGVLWAGGMDIWLVLAVSLLAGIAAGMFNGFLIAVLGLPSLAVTIGTLALFRGLALVTIGDNAVANFPKPLTAFFTSKTSSGNWQLEPGPNWSTDHDPGFVNMEKANYRLRRSAEVFKQLKGFAAIPFEEIGHTGNAP